MMDDTKLDDVKLLLEVSQLFTFHDLEAVLRNAVDLAARAVGATNASLILYYDGRVDWQYIINIKEQEPEEAPRIVNEILSRGLAGWVARNREIAIIDDTHADPRWHKITDYNEHVRSALSIPLIHHDELVAILTLVHTQPDYFTDHHRRLMTIIANQAAVAIHNLRIFKQLQAQQNQLSTILHAIQDVLIVINQEGDIILTNESARQLLGLPSGMTAIGQSMLHLVTVDDTLQPVVEWLRQPIPEIPFVFETHSQHFKRDFSGRIAEWTDNENQFGFVITLHDVTTLRDLARFKDEMLRLASHDLRSPLNLIVGYADMIALDTPDTASPVHEHIEIIHNATARMNTLLEDLLRVEQIRQSPLELQQQVDPFKLVKIALVNMRHAAEIKHQSLESQIRIHHPTCITADPVLIRQAMENLIGNAIKYTPDKGKIVVYAYTEEDCFHFIVEDTGIGIPQDELPRVFDAFYRVRTANHNETAGTGLGLNLVRDVIERHEGQVWVTSQPQEGSRFGFTLPLNTYPESSCV